MYCTLAGACVPDLPSGYKQVNCDKDIVICEWCGSYVCKYHAKFIYGFKDGIGYACHKCIALNRKVLRYEQHIPATAGCVDSFIKSVQEIHSNDLTKNTK